MKGLFLVFHGFAAHNGISKKIFSQLAALRECGLEVELCYVACSADEHWKRMAGQQVVEDFGPGIRGKIGKRVRYGALIRYIRENGVKFVYMRADHNANPFLNRWLGQMKRMGVKVVMEIPTYPYDSEYSRAPLRARAVLQIDKIFRGAMARRLSRIVTFSDLSAIFGVPTIRISNGIDFGAIPLKASENRPGDVIRLTGVADIHFWHGFDRVIEGMAEYYRTSPEQDVEFHVVGSGVPSQLEMLRSELHSMVDARVDGSIQRILTSSVLEESPTLPLHTDPSVFKGKKPEAVLFPNGQSVRTPTWKAAVLAILQDCNADPAMHTYLMELRGKVMGRQRTILAASPEKMHAPLEIDKGLYMESYYDTASLLYVLKNRVLDEVGYNYSGIRVQLRQEQEEAQKQSPRMDEMTL